LPSTSVGSAQFASADDPQRGADARAEAVLMLMTFVVFVALSALALAAR